MSHTVRLITRISGVLLMIAGLVMVVVGFVAWSTVGSELASQKINVAAEGQPENIANGPMDALSQINLIKTHTTEGVTAFGLESGTVYSEVPRPDAALLAQCQADPTQAATDECQTAINNDAARTYLDNSNFKQASLYTSILAFGVSFLVGGLGLAFLLVGLVQLAQSGKKENAKAAPTRKEQLATV